MLFSFVPPGKGFAEEADSTSGGIGSDLRSVIVLKGIQTFPFAQEISKTL